MKDKLEFPGEWTLIKRAMALWRFSLIDFIGVCTAISSGIIWYHGNDFVRSIYVGFLCGAAVMQALNSAAGTGMMMAFLEVLNLDSLKPKKEDAEESAS